MRDLTKFDKRFNCSKKWLNDNDFTVENLSQSEIFLELFKSVNVEYLKHKYLSVYVRAIIITKDYEIIQVKKELY